MRIVAGRYKGRVLLAPEGLATRPTAERAREALFDILSHVTPTLSGATVADVFAGSGALGLEAISRGAVHASFFETDAAALSVIRANVRKLGLSDEVAILRADALSPPKAPRPCQFLFLDPPYKSGLAVPAVAALVRQGWLAQGGRIIVEVAAGEGFTAPLPELVIADERKYGAARLVFLERKTDSP